MEEASLKDDYLVGSVETEKKPAPEHPSAGEKGDYGNTVNFCD